jgi:rubrerythrin
MSVDRKQLAELAGQCLETERGGVQIYETAVQCARNPDLKKEWKKYLKQTTRHVEIATEMCTALDVDPDGDSPGRAVVRSLGEALVQAMRSALEAGDKAAAEIVAGECVTLAETKDHLNWKLLTECAKKLTGDAKKAVQKAADEVEDEEDEHLYHSAGWTRELWLESLGVGGVLPPPEEEKHVKSAIGAARAEKQRASMK